MSTRETGQAFETAARQHLERAGLRLLAANVGYRFGELDLVMRDGEAIAFIEVRYRRSSGFGGAPLSVTPTKRRRIALAASAWLAAHPELARCPCRFDVVAIGGSAQAPCIDWIRAAFSLDELG